MAAAKKALMKAELDVDPCAEMHKKTAEYAKKDPDLKKLFAKRIVYSETIEVDSRKWSPQKLSKALTNLVKYELKLLDVAVADALKKGDASDVPRALKKLTKKMETKCADALEELESAGGDNKKALKEGTTTFKEVNRLNIGLIFLTPRTSMDKIFTLLIKGVTNAEDLLASQDGDTDKARKNPDGDASGKKADPARKKLMALAEKKRAEAFLVAARKVDTVKGKYLAEKKTAEGVIQTVLKLGESLRKNDDLDAELSDFSEDIKDAKKLLDKFLAEMNACDVDLGEASKDIKSRKDSAKILETKRHHFMTAGSRRDKIAANAGKKLTELSSRFSKVAAKLK